MADSTLPSLSGNAALDRARRRFAEDIAEFLDPDATVTFAQATTETTNALPALLNTGLTATGSTGQIIAASTQMEDRINLLHRAVNNIVDILQANQMALTT